MLRQGEGGWPISIEGVTLLTAIEIRGGCELALVFIRVAVQALGKFHLVECVFSLRDVTLRAGHGRVLGLQGIGACRVLLHPELCGLEAVYGMAGSTFAAVGSLDELPLMFVLVAVHAALEGERFLEISTGMAPNAVHLLVFAQQRVLGLGVIEVLVQSSRGNALPAGSVVAGLAALLGKTPVMRVAVAVGTFSEWEADIARLVIRSRGVAFLTGYLSVEPGQWVTGLGVVKLPGSVLPIGGVVALLAILA